MTGKGERGEGVWKVGGKVGKEQREWEEGVGMKRGRIQVLRLRMIRGRKEE